MPFDFYSVPRVVFGRGAFARIGELARGLGDRALVVASPRAASSTGAAGGGAMTRVEESLRAAGVRFVAAWQKGEPTARGADELTDAARRSGSNLLIALGGGSAIDAAKAVAGLLTNGGAALDYMEVVGAGKKIAAPAAPWIAVPTTAGTGAEATRNAVVAAPEKHFKASIRSELLLPRVALVDPELGVGAPPDVTAAAGMDALCQLIESYTSAGASAMTDALAEAGIPLAARCLPRAVRNGADLDAREGMALAALWSGICLTNAGLGAVHGVAAPLGAHVAAPHGAVCAALLPHIVAANVRALRERSHDHPALARYAKIGRAMASARPPQRHGEHRENEGGLPGLGGHRGSVANSAKDAISDADAIDTCIRFLHDLTRELRIAPLSSFGLTRELVPTIASLAGRSSSMRYNPVALSEEALAGALLAAM